MPPDEVTTGPVPPLPGELPPPIVQPAFSPPTRPASRATPGGVQLRWLAFLIGAAGVGLAAIGIRSAALLGGRIDPDLVTTPELQSIANVALLTQVAVVGLALLVLILGSRWGHRIRSALAQIGDPGPLLAAAPGTARIARTLLSLGAGLIALAGIGLVFPLGRDAARALWVVTAVGASLLPVGAALLIWLIGDIERREAIALNAADPRQPAPGDRDRRWPLAAIALLATLAVIPPAANIPYLWSDHVCHAADLECRWVVVQADQLADDPRGPTAVLHYGLRRADKASQGTLVIATGGPGVSGVSAYTYSVASLDTRLTDAYDIVVFDARGVGESGYVDCPAASQSYQSSLTFAAVPAVIKDFVSACIDETGVDPASLMQYGSANLVEDIETIRLDLGVDRIALYGESYGTLVAQRYAVAHPDRLEALILDGAIDIKQPTDESWIEATEGFERILRRSLGTCRDTDGCRFGDGTVWSHIMDSVADGSVSARYADTDGSMTDWPLNTDLVRETLLSAMYDVSTRMLVLRGLTAAEAGDWVPLARLVYSGSVYGNAAAVSDFAYYATSCADRHRVGPELDAAQFMAKARSSPFATTRTGSVYLSSAACYAWPLSAGTRPPVAVPSAADFPVMILSATGDPITPAEHGQRIFDRYSGVTDTYLVRTNDGPHVTFGRGRECPDDVVVALLVDDRRPPTGTSCRGEIVAPFLELATEQESADPLEFRGRALDLELLAHPDFIAWDGLDTLAIGCRFGGRIEVTSEATGDDFVDTIAIDRCAVLRDDPMSGTGTYRGTDEAEFDVTFPDGDLSYRIVGEWRHTMFEETSVAWDGTFEGRSIEGRR
jgi:pimeloyl-ACP methyl ester carboxylesterase